MKLTERKWRVLDCCGCRTAGRRGGRAESPNGLDLLPDWVGYALIFWAIAPLSGLLRDFPLLRPFCILLGASAGADWLSLPLAGQALTDRLFPLRILLACVGLYFHFQLLNDLFCLADWRAEEGAAPLGRRLRVCRNIDAVLRVILLFPLSGEVWKLLYAMLLVLGFGNCLVIMFRLFRLRDCFPPEEA